MLDAAPLTTVLFIGGIALTLVAIYFTSRTPRPAATPLLWVGGLALLGINLWLSVAPLSTTDSGSASPTNPIALSADSIAQGQTLYQGNCVRCHGETLKGNGPDAATLTVPPANLLEHVPHHEDGALFTLLTNGMGQMPSFSTVLTEPERWHIINYLRDATKDSTAEHGETDGHDHSEAPEHSMEHN